MQSQIDRSLEFTKAASAIASQAPEMHFESLGIDVKIILFHDAIQIAAGHTSEHEHHFYEISTQIAGEMVYLIDNVQVKNTDQNNQIVFLRPGLCHKRYSHSQLSIIRGLGITIIPYDAAGENLIARLNKTLVEIGFKIAMTDSIKKRFEQIEHWYIFQNEVAKKIFLNDSLSLVAEILGAIFGLINYDNNFHAAESRSVSHKNICDGIKMYVENMMNQPFSVKFFTNKFQMSSQHLNRIFKAKNQKSIAQYTYERRMFNARKLLLNQRITVSDVATALGFSSVTYFITFFRKHQKISPGEFQKLNRKI
jgi:AraC-like DNA-binding protein